MKIEGQTVEIHVAATEIFQFLNNMNHIGSLMPEQITDWRGDEHSATFTIKNMGSSGLQFGNHQYPVKINMISSESSKIKFELSGCLKELGSQLCRVNFELSSEVNPFIAAMVQKPLQHLTDTMAKKLKQNLSGGASQ